MGGGARVGVVKERKVDEWRRGMQRSGVERQGEGRM